MAIISNAVTMADAGAFSVGLGSKVLIKTLTASSSSTLSFVHGSSSVVLDSTFPIYKFEFISMHAATDEALFEMNMSIDAGSNYNVAKTTTYFRSQHGESGGGGEVAYDTGQDAAQATGFIRLCGELGTVNDENMSGEMFLYNPSSTTFVKHFMCRANMNASGDACFNIFSAGYGNTTSDVDAIRFKMSSGNIDAGKIKLYGIKDS